MTISVSAITEKDQKDIQTAIEYGVDYIALSFVSKAADVRESGTLLKESSSPHIGIISKIERRSAVDNVIEIAEESNIVMVARGDLGVSRFRKGARNTNEQFVNAID